MDKDKYVRALEESTQAINRNTAVLESICALLSEHFNIKPVAPETSKQTLVFSEGSNQNSVSVEHTELFKAESSVQNSSSSTSNSDDIVAEMDRFISELFGDKR